MLMSMDYSTHIRYLENKYKDTNVAMGECLSKEERSRINKKYYDEKVRWRQVQGVLNGANVNSGVEKEVHQITGSLDSLKQLCPRCKEEQIIAVVVLYVQRGFNNRLQEDKTALWRKFGLDWKLYGRIVANLLRVHRRCSPLPRNVS